MLINSQCRSNGTSMKSSVTISLVESLKGPWIFRDELSVSIPKAKKIGFDGIELFPASANDIDGNLLHKLLDDNQINLSAIATGAGRILHNLTLTSPDKTIRTKAVDFVKRIIDFGAPFKAPAIIGSMQGNIGQNNRQDTLTQFAETLSELGRYAADRNIELLFASIFILQLR